MPKEKTLEEKLEEASSAVERALEARDKAIQDLMEAKMAYGEVWRKLHDKSQAPVQSPACRSRAADGWNQSSTGGKAKLTPKLH